MVHTGIMSDAPPYNRSETLAPWADIVPDVGPMTIDAYEALPDDGWIYELVEGVLVRMPQSGGEASAIAARLLIRLGAYVEERGLGELTGEAGGYNFSDLGQPDTGLGPDVAFVRAERVATLTSEQYVKAWPLAPDLAVEVASPNHYHPGMAIKAKHYLDAGVRLVWIIWPRWQQVDLRHPGDDKQSSATLGIEDTLSGEDVVPGFSCPVAVLLRRPIGSLS